MLNVNRDTRAGKCGKEITCRYCRSAVTVYHFSWSALVCWSCKASVDKANWYIDDRTEHTFPVCGACHGDNIRADATLEWNYLNQEWVVFTTNKNDRMLYCGDCMEEVVIEWYKPNELCNGDCNHRHCR